MGLEVDSKDIDEVEGHSQKLNTEGLIELHSVSLQEDVEEISSEEEEITASEKQQPSSEIREMLKAWKTVASFVEKQAAMRSKHLFNDNAVSHFRQILKRRQKQMSLDNFLVIKVVL